MQVPVKPVIAWVYPDPVVAPLAPTGQTKVDGFLGRVALKVISQGSEAKILIGGSAANEVEPLWALKPPVAEKLRVKRSHHYWRFG